MSAIISCCGRYRYRLEREIGMHGLTFAYFGINPSTADAQLDDATVRKWIGFTKVNGGRRFIVGNAFAFRSTDVGALRYAENPVGTRNASFIAKIIADADVLVPCWGDGTKVSEPLRKRLDELADRLLCSGKPVKVFGFTKSGDPKHPLMLGYDTPLIAWETRERPRIRR